MGYPNCSAPAVVPVQGITPQRRRPADVKAAFGRVRTNPHYLAAWVGEDFIPAPRYTYSFENKNGRDNHFQGVVRLPDGKHLLVTGGDIKEPEGHMFIVNMASRQAHSSWGTNRLTNQLPPSTDVATGRWCFGGDKWHPGGVDFEGNVLVVPLEHHEADSVIRFFDVSAPPHVDRYDLEIVRDTTTLPGRTDKARKAAAAGIVTLPGGRVLVVIRVGDGLGFDFYLSNGIGLQSGFPRSPVEFPDGKVKNETGNWVSTGGYQSVTLLREGGTDDLYLFGAYNTSFAAPLQQGTNRVDLFQLDFDASTATVNSMTRLERKNFPYNGYHNMDAGTTVHVDPRGDLHVYCVQHFRSNDRMKLCEFQAPHPANLPPLTQVQRGWIELYDENDFKGNCLLLRGKRDSDLENYADVFVNGRGFDKAVASVRYQLPDGVRYRLYRRHGYIGAHPATLTGNGLVKELRSLGSARRKISSSKFL